MTTIVPDEGLDWYRDVAIGAVAENEILYDVAVGDGSTSPSSSDTQLANELFRGNNDSNNIDITPTSNVGEYEVSISVAGGTEVPAGSDIRELGVWGRDPSISSGNVTESDDKMVYREVRAAITIESGDRKSFNFTITITE